MKRLSGLVGVMACAVTVAQAQIRAGHVPSDATAVIHVDLKELNASPMGLFVRQSLDDNMKRGLDWLQSVCGINLTNDVDSFVAYTQGGLRTSNVVQVASGRFNVARLTSAAGGAKEFQNKAVGERSLLSWRENATRRQLCFVDPTMVLLAWDEQQILQALARIDGPAQAGGETPFDQVLSHKKGRFLALQANSAAELAVNNPQFQMLKQAEALRLEIGQMADTNGLVGRLVVKAANKELAQQMGQAALGIQALFQLQAAQNPEVAAIAQGVHITQQDDFVTLDMELTEEMLKKLIQVRVEQHKAAVEARKKVPGGPGKKAHKAVRPEFDAK